MSDEDKLVRIASTGTDIEARILSGILEEAGISVHVSGEHAATGRTQALGWVAVMVLQKDAERAREILLKAKQDAKDMGWDKVDFDTPG